MESNHSEIQEFYKDKTVFLTGVTGFLGKLLLEKLLSSTEVKKIYVLVRRKDQKNAQTRFQDLLECPIFDNIKRSSPDAFKKVIVINGDMSVLNLGISEEYLKELVDNVECIFHTALAAKLGQSIKDAVFTNVKGTAELIEIARAMKKLKCFVINSTAYSNCIHKEIDEKIYDIDIDVNAFVTLVENNGSNALEKYKNLTSKWPNNFTFTMALAEKLIKDEAGKLPVAVVRCSSIVATNQGPIRGFIDSCHGPTGVVIGVGLGMLRVFYGTEENKADIVTADYVINNCIAAGWSVNEYLDYDKCNKVYEKEKFPIYNCVCTPRNPIQWDDFSRIVDKYGKESPSSKVLWYPYKIVTNCSYNYILLSFLLHRVPAFFIDLMLTCLGKKPVFGGFYNRMSNFSGTIQYFMNNSWTFNDGNNQELLKCMTRKDRELFNFDISDIDWESYLEYYVKGIRVYILKDDMNTIAQGKSKLKLLKYLHYFLTFVAFAIFYFALRWTLKRALSFFW